jgi:hypothetical protein
LDADILLGRLGFRGEVLKCSSLHGLQVMWRNVDGALRVPVKDQLEDIAKREDEHGKAGELALSQHIGFGRCSSQGGQRVCVEITDRRHFGFAPIEYQNPGIEDSGHRYSIQKGVEPRYRNQCCVFERDNME